MKYALGSNLILTGEYGSTRPKTHVSEVLDTHLSSYAVQSQKSDGALRISMKITIASLKKQIVALREKHLEKFFCNFLGVNGT